jgi:Protein of unknown function (DUF3014)
VGFRCSLVHGLACNGALAPYVTAAARFLILTKLPSLSRVSGVDRAPNRRTIVSTGMIPESNIERRKGRRALTILLGFVLLIPLAIGIGSYRLLKTSSQRGAPALAPLEATPLVQPRVAAPTTIPPRADLPPLDSSDAFLRKLAAALSSNPAWGKWLLTDRLARRFVASVDNVAEGRSPKPHLGVLAPSGEFKANERGDAATIDQASFRRYDVVTGVIASLDVKGSAQLYQETLPLFRDAYKELGYPDRNFDDTLAKAIRQLLATPEPAGDVALRPAVKSWKLADPALEDLTPAQKHLLRMGPENEKKVKQKLRELAEALNLAV